MRASDFPDTATRGHELGAPATPTESSVRLEQSREQGSNRGFHP